MKAKAKKVSWQEEHWESCKMHRPTTCTYCFLLYNAGLIDWQGRRTDKAFPLAEAAAAHAR